MTREMNTYLFSMEKLTEGGYIVPAHDIEDAKYFLYKWFQKMNQGQRDPTWASDVNNREAS